MLFWSHVEVLVERTLQCAARHLPTPVREDLFRRYAVIGVRMDRLAALLIGRSMHALWDALDFADVTAHLRRVQAARNAFIHGDPDRIDDPLVVETVQMLPRFHAAWLALHNWVALESLPQVPAG